ncbi:MAG: alpha/beta fold hydrolase, partial [Chloroflexi bacterium]
MLPNTVRALYPFKSSFMTLSDGHRMHYAAEGPEDGEVLVFVHGYPTWSFVYRALLVYYGALGYRCIAVDHIGCGLSDKPTSRRYHTLQRHIQNLAEFLKRLNL